MGAGQYTQAKSKSSKMDVPAEDHPAATLAAYSTKNAGVYKTLLLFVEWKSDKTTFIEK